MGKNFDLNYGSVITTDTRFGLPKYNSKDSYLFDGVLLEEKDRQGDFITYKALKEKDFEKIIRYNAGKENDFWEVISKNGTHRFYENTKDSCVGLPPKIYTWNITKTIDVYKNNIIYEYEKDSGFVYPKAIFYTGKNNTKGNYSVRFYYDENIEERKDLKLEARF